MNIMILLEKKLVESRNKAQALIMAGNVYVNEIQVNKAGDFFKDDILIKDGGTIGSASDADAITIASDGVTTFSQKDVHSVGLSVKNGSSSAGFVEFFENSGNGSNKVTLIGPASSGDVTLTLPSTAGTVATTASAADEATALAIALG